LDHRAEIVRRTAVSACHTEIFEVDLRAARGYRLGSRRAGGWLADERERLVGSGPAVLGGMEFRTYAA
jgi:hypothetical protein